MSTQTTPDEPTGDSVTTTVVTDPNAPGWKRPSPGPRAFRNDALLAGALFLGAVLSSTLYRLAGLYTDAAPEWVTLIWAAAFSAPLAWRRRWPSIVAVVVSCTFIAGQMVLVPEVLVSNIVLFLALYSVGAWVNERRRASLVRIAIIGAMFVWLLTNMFITATDPNALDGFSRAGALSPFVAFMLIQLLTNVLYFGGAYYFGDVSYRSARQRAVIEERTRELEIERERSAGQAVALERLRIARELHDVVAHHVSVMGVQAGAARTVLETNPQAAREALEGVESGARSAIDELRGLLHTLRESAPEASASASASTIGLAALEDLADESSEAGLPTTFDVIGEPRTLSAFVSLNLYRVAQEALTNARKYAGPDATANMRLRYLDRAVELEITNTGNVPAKPRAGGLGHAGMRERVDAMNGALELGPRTRGGYLVRVNVPMLAEERLPADHGADTRIRPVPSPTAREQADRRRVSAGDSTRAAPKEGQQ